MKTTLMFFTKDSRGGMNTLLHQMRMLDEKKYKSIFCLYKQDDFVEYKKDIIFISKSYPQQLSFSLSKCWHLILNLYKTIKIVNQQNPNIIISFSSYSFITFSILKIICRYQMPFVAIFNNNVDKIIKKKPGRLYKKLIITTFQLLTSFPDKFIFTSENLAMLVSQKFNIDKSKIVIIPHSVNLESVKKLSIQKIEKSKANELSRKNINKIFSVGRLEKQKDFKTILKAFSLIVKKKKNSNLFIIGDGPQLQELKKLSKKLKIEKKVNFLGWKKNIYKYLKHADVFLFSSFFEGFAMVIIEAMALSIPVVVTNSPYGPAEIVDNGKFGFLVPVQNHHQLATKTLDLLKNKKLLSKYKKLSMERSKSFSLKEMLDKYDLLFSQLIKNKH